MHARGFTLIELLITSAVGVVLALAAWPSYESQLLRAHRAEAIEALQRIQLAQERHRETYGRYATELRNVGFADTTGGGRYALVLEPLGVETYRLSAHTRRGSRQHADQRCPTLALEVRQGFATLAPDGRCWNR